MFVNSVPMPENIIHEIVRVEIVVVVPIKIVF